MHNGLSQKLFMTLKHKNVDNDSEERMKKHADQDATFEMRGRFTQSVRSVEVYCALLESWIWWWWWRRLPI